MWLDRAQRRSQNRTYVRTPVPGEPKGSQPDRGKPTAPCSSTAVGAQSPVSLSMRATLAARRSTSTLGAHHWPDHPTLWRAIEPALRDGYPCYRRIGSAIESSGTPPNDGGRPACPRVTTGSETAGSEEFVRARLLEPTFTRSRFFRVRFAESCSCHCGSALRRHGVQVVGAAAAVVAQAAASGGRVRWDGGFRGSRPGQPATSRARLTLSRAGSSGWQGRRATRLRLPGGRRCQARSRHGRP